MSGGNGGTGPSKGAVLQSNRVKQTLAKVAQAQADLAQPPQGYPIRPPAKRTALVAPLAFQPVPSRTQLASQKGG